MTDNNAHARAILDDTCYAVLASADGDGAPWATPVWFAHDGLDRIYWLSWPGSRHSQLIEQRPEMALTVFDSNAVPHQATAFYATARAGQCPDEQLQLQTMSIAASTMFLFHGHDSATISDRPGFPAAWC